MSILKLRYEPDPEDDVGKLWMTVETACFSGEGFFWSYRDGARELADKLKLYPLPDAAEAKWGYDDVAGEKIVLSLRVVPVNKTGDLVVEAEIADLQDLRQRVTAIFSTTYAEAETFRQQLESLMDGSGNAAELLGRS